MANKETSKILEAYVESGGSRYFFASKIIKAFPCARRGVDSSVTPIIAFDLEAKLNTEANMIKAGTNMSGLIPNYLQSWNDGVLTCVIGGYTFTINVETTDLRALSEGNTKDIWFKIKKSSRKIYSTQTDLANVDTFILDRLYTQVAANSEDLDDKISSTKEKLDAFWGFLGLEIIPTTEKVTTTKDEFVLKILNKNGTVPAESYLPDIKAGSVAFSSSIKNLQTTTISNDETIVSKGAISTDNNLTVNGTSSLTGKVTTNAGLLNTSGDIVSTGNTTLEGTFINKGTACITQKLTTDAGIENKGTITSHGAISTKNNLTVDGTSTLKGNVTTNGDILIAHAASKDMSPTTANPKISFAEIGSNGIEQHVHLVYTDYNDYREPAGLKVMGNGDTSGGTSSSKAWFEVEGKTITDTLSVAGTSTFTGAITANGGVTGNLTGNATSADKFKSDKNIALTGPITGNANGGSTGNWSIATTITDNAVTTTKIANDAITAAKLGDIIGTGSANANGITVGLKQESSGALAPTITCTSVGLADVAKTLSGFSRLDKIDWGTLQPSAGWACKLRLDTEGGGSLALAQHSGTSSSDILSLQIDGDVYVQEGAKKLATEDWVKNTATAHSVAWGNITGKPSTYNPSPHTHDDRYYTESEINTKLSTKSNTGHDHGNKYVKSYHGSSPKDITLDWSGEAGSSDDWPYLLAWNKNGDRIKATNRYPIYAAANFNEDITSGFNTKSGTEYWIYQRSSGDIYIGAKTASSYIGEIPGNVYSGNFNSDQLVALNAHKYGVDLKNIEVLTQLTVELYEIDTAYLKINLDITPPLTVSEFKHSYRQNFQISAAHVNNSSATSYTLNGFDCWVRKGTVDNTYGAIAFKISPHLHFDAPANIRLLRLEGLFNI